MPAVQGELDPRTLRRLRLIRFMALLLLVVGWGRLTYLQVAAAPEDYSRAASDDFTTRQIPAQRGDITDRNGELLAVSVEARNVIADPSLVTDPQGEAEQLANLLNVDAATLAEQLSREGRYALLAKGVTPALWERVDALDLPGIGSEPAVVRSYPGGSLAANLLGFVNWEGLGAGGLELAYQRELAGTPGERTYYGGSSTAAAAAGLVEPVNGQDLRLTIDRDIQWLAQQAIAKRVKEAKAEAGTVVVMDVRTGDILAMATAPSFNPNNLAKAKAANLGNRVLTNTYEPGSVGKIMTIAAVLEEGTMTPESKLTVPNRLRVADKNFRDHEDHPTLRLTLTGVLAKSSNIGTIKAADTISGKTLYQYFRRFGIGQDSGLGFPGEESGSLLEPADWSATTKPTFAFGQGYSTNALQSAMVFATMANGGVRMTPRLVAGFTGDDGVFRAAPKSTGVRVVSERTADAVTRMMESVTGEGGTAPSARIRGYRVAGKTGTAQLLDASCDCYNGYLASFIGMAPADDPRIVVAVSLVRPKGFSHYGGVLAGPVFREVMSFTLQQLRLPPSGAQPPKFKLEW